MNMVDRRHFLSLLGAAGVSAALPGGLFAAPAAAPFTFLFITDTHLEPELDAAKGTAMAFRKARGSRRTSRSRAAITSLTR